MSHGFQIPTLETERLRLRAHAAHDFDACVEMWAHPIVTKYTTGSPSTEQRTWQRVLGYLGHWQLMQYGFWAIEEKSSKKYIGEVGFADNKRQMEPAIGAIPELGWALVPEFHGKGYATEATRAAISWGDQNLKSTKTICIVSPENLPSIRVAEKCGFKQFQKANLSGELTLLYSRQR